MSFVQIPVQTYPNTAFGYEVLKNIVPNSPVSGIGNTGFGYQSLSSAINASQNTAIGYWASKSITSGSGNTAIGWRAMSESTVGNQNVAIGSGSLNFVSGQYNVAIGGDTGSTNVVSGSSNIFLGNSAGQNMQSGSRNVIIGAFTGFDGVVGDIRNQSNYVVLADGAGNVRLWVDPAGLVTAPGGFAGGGGGATITIDNKTTNYTVVSGDLGHAINCTGAGGITIALTSSATLGSGFVCWIWNNTSGTVTIDPFGAQTIDGVSTLVLRKGEGTQVVANGVNWDTGAKKTMRMYAENYDANASRPVAQGDQSTAIGGFAQALNTGCIAIGSGARAGNNYAMAIGNNSGNGGSYVNASGACALNGSYAVGVDSFSAALGTNSSYGAQGQNSVALGSQNTALSYASLCAGGIFNTASNNQSVAYGGGFNTANGLYSYALGYGGTTQGVTLKWSFGNRFSTSGDAQNSKMVLKRSTGNATPQVMNTTDSTPATTNLPVIQDNSAIAFTGTVVAREQAALGGSFAAFKIEGVMTRGVGAATTALSGATVTTISNPAGWAVALAANTTLGALEVRVTGAATAIRWVCTLESTEVIYA